MTQNPKRLVLLFHGGKEGRGAVFEPVHYAALARAANDPHYALIEIEQVKLDQINPDLPAGKLEADGKPGELPVMLRASFERLLELAEAGKATRPGKAAGAAAGAAGKGADAALPAPWSAIVVGSVVLASDSRDDGWWECVVVAFEDDRATLRLKWRDFPSFDEFRKPVTRVGLLPHSGLR